MTLRVSGKNLDLGQTLRLRISERIEEVVGKYFDGGYSGHVTVAKDGIGFRTECAIHLDSRVTFDSEGDAADAYASADQAALKVEKQLRRYHRKLKDHRSDRSDAPETAASAWSDGSAEPDDSRPPSDERRPV